MSAIKEIHIQNKSLNPTRNRKEVLNILKELYEKGYRYVVRDEEMPYLVCFSLKPKRYQDTESWGYIGPNERGAVMAYTIKNTDVSEIKYSNRSAALISDFLAKE